MMDAAIMDFDAVAALRARPFDRPYKGLPADVSTVDDLVGRQVPLDGFLPPVAVLDWPALAANLDRYADYCVLHGLDFARAKAGNNIAAKIAMIAMTTNNSISVNALVFA